LLVSWCAGDRCGMTCSDEDRGRSRRPDTEDQGWSHMSGTRWSDGRVAPCVVCTWHVETRSAGFLVEAQKQGQRFMSGLTSKLVAMVFTGLASKPVATVFFSLASKLVATVSPDLTSKSVVSFLIEPQNQGSGGFPDLGLKIGSSGLVIWTSKSPRQFLGLGLKIKHASVYRLCYKTNGGRSTRDTHRDLAACLV
jgi:hypothetical protein